MVWAVVLHEKFDAEFELLEAAVQDELLATPSCSRSSGRASDGPGWIRSKDRATPT
jgi:hypothetical protein